MTPPQCRAARVLLGWTVQTLANVADVSTTTVVNFENGNRRAQSSTIRILRAAFETAGIEFLGEATTDDAEVEAIQLTDGSTVRLRRRG